MPETVLLRCEGGAVIEHDVPLPLDIQKRVDKGDISIVESESSAPVKRATTSKN